MAPSKKVKNAANISQEKKLKVIMKKKAKNIKEKLSGKNYSPIVEKIKNTVILSKHNESLNKEKGKTKKSPKMKDKKPDNLIFQLKEVKKKKTTSPTSQIDVELKSFKRKEQAIKTTPVVENTPKVQLKSKKKALYSPANKIQTSNIVSKSIPKKVQDESFVIEAIDKTKKIKVVPTIKETKNVTPKKITGNANDSSEITDEKTADIRNAVSPRKKIRSERLEKINITNLKSVNIKSLNKKTGKSTGSSESKDENTDDIKAEKVSPETKKIKKKVSKGDLKPISNIRTLRKGPGRGYMRKKGDIGKNPERGVCYFSHIPHGFYEKQLEKYCSQFGRVTGVYHPLSKKGNSRGYAFVEFENKEVAEVVAETMNNYLMCNRLLKCELVSAERQKPWVFRREKNNKMIATEKRINALKLRTKKLSAEEEAKWTKKRKYTVKLLHKKLSKLGIDYDFKVVENSGAQKASQ